MQPKVSISNSQSTTEKKRVLFFHNTLPEYRIEFWNKLNDLCNLTVAILEPELESKVYGFELGTVNFRAVNVLGSQDITRLIANADAVILPPLDDLKCIKITFDIKKKCRKRNIPFFFWTEKWEAPADRTPTKKKVKNLLQRNIFRICSSGSKRYIASGTKAKEYLMKIGVKEEKIRIAVDSSTSPYGEYVDIREKYGIAKDKKIILYLGRLIKRKGCDALIRACKDNLKDWNATLLICGDGAKAEEYKTMAADNPDIIFAGKVQPNERRNYYEQSDLFVLPSVITDGVVEGWGLSVNEALDCGTPVIVTEAVGAGYDAINETNGIVVKDGSVNELSKAIETILKESLNRGEIIKDNVCTVDNMAIAFGNAIEL